MPKVTAWNCNQAIKRSGFWVFFFCVILRSNFVRSTRCHKPSKWPSSPFFTLTIRLRCRFRFSGTLHVFAFVFLFFSTRFFFSKGQIPNMLTAKSLEFDQSFEPKQRVEWWKRILTWRSVLCSEKWCIVFYIKLLVIFNGTVGSRKSKKDPSVMVRDYFSEQVSTEMVGVLYLAS